MPSHDDRWALKKYLLYDFARDRLADSRLFASYDAATRAANGQSTLMVVTLVLGRATSPGQAEPCEYLLTGQF
jgi:hypothetical protein